MKNGEKPERSTKTYHQLIFMCGFRRMFYFFSAPSNINREKL